MEGARGGSGAAGRGRGQRLGSLSQRPGGLGGAGGQGGAVKAEAGDGAAAAAAAAARPVGGAGGGAGGAAGARRTKFTPTLPAARRRPAKAAAGGGAAAGASAAAPAAEGLDAQLPDELRDLLKQSTEDAASTKQRLQLRQQQRAERLAQRAGGDGDAGGSRQRVIFGGAVASGRADRSVLDAESGRITGGGSAAAEAGPARATAVKTEKKAAVSVREVEDRGPKLKAVQREDWTDKSKYYPTLLPVTPQAVQPPVQPPASGPATVPAFAAANDADELRLNEADADEADNFILLQLPSSLPLAAAASAASAAAAANGANGASDTVKDEDMDDDEAPEKEEEKEEGPRPAAVSELPPGRLGKLLVYESGKVKLQVGEMLFDVTPGALLTHSEEVAAFVGPTSEAVFMGAVDRHATVVPDMDAILAVSTAAAEHAMEV